MTTHVEIHSSRESEVRSYCRSYPTRFATASGATLTDDRGVEYIDFLAGCGSLNYGHNCPPLRDALIDYVAKDGVAMTLDMSCVAKTSFMTRFEDLILKPRGLRYRFQFTGPTGANAIEAAIKLARKVTGRTNIVSFTNGFHGCSLGALSLTGNNLQRASSAPLLNQVVHMPYDGYFGRGIDTAVYFAQLLDDPSSGVDVPAAVVFESIQGEGGLSTATSAWLSDIARIASDRGILVICDEIQTGCGRSGDFFAFEKAKLDPDMVVLAKSLSGFGLPMSLLLLRQELDQWSPAEHNGTFRGNAHAFVTATAALEHFWTDDQLAETVRAKADVVRDALGDVAEFIGGHVKGRGLMTGLETSDPAFCKQLVRECFEQGLVVESCGPHNSVLKPLPPLNTSMDVLEEGLHVIGRSAKRCADRSVRQA